MVLCDPELSVGLSTPAGKAGVTTRGHGRGGAWTPVGVSGQPGAVDAYVFGREDARELAGKGHEIALKVKEGFSGIAQEMYKVCLRPRSSNSLFVNVELIDRSFYQRRYAARTRPT